MKAIKIEGVEDCLRMFDKAPENMLKISKKAMREASKATAKQMRSGIPKRWRKLVKYKIMDNQGKVSARIGLYNDHQTSGHQPASGKIFDWFKVYWANYGTLENRDPGHQFQYKVKKKTSRRRNDKGQPAQNFFEMASKQWEDVFVKKFEQEILKNENELYNR